MNTDEIERLKIARDEAKRFIESVDAALTADKNQKIQNAQNDATYKKTGRWPECKSFRAKRHYATTKRRSVDLSNALYDLRREGSNR